MDSVVADEWVVAGVVVVLSPLKLKKRKHGYIKLADEVINLLVE
jgi:hypothetical protein